MVRMDGFEPSRRKPLPPQDSVSTNSTTSANHFHTPRGRTLTKHPTTTQWFSNIIPTSLGERGDNRSLKLTQTYLTLVKLVWC